ncbi:MAG: signal recognition particle-docking protein FtsY [Clostridia bacterium]|nr:signal recognition particle-docking protein FtsY [Clostridia bacterium]MBQ1942930.1 signal recognition particle-docking protein FtsY [Clostridia bacterium]MBQ5801797.1 signal recognition particle-docking protein FtsY [Clostridia bacterium]
MSFFSKLFGALKKTKDSLAGKLAALFRGNYFADEFYEELEDILISSDISVSTAEEIIEDLRERVKEEKLKDEEFVRQALRDSLIEHLNRAEPYDFVDPTVIMVVGVNGVGKTTSIGKLARYFTQRKQTVTIAAADTFRAAAADQLSVWADRAKVKIVRSSEGSDPSAVVFDALSSAKAKSTDVLIIDTAGRLHVKANLMEELKKMRRVIDREYPEANVYTLIVLDATTGQNAISQVETFNEAVGLDGIVLTKLDGTAKGGFVVSLCSELEVPVLFVGTGEKIEDLEEFDAESFVDAIL